MTNIEKFQKGIVVTEYMNDEVLLELWGGSTKHPDSMFWFSSFEKPIWYDANDEYGRNKAIFQWLIECASKLSMPSHTKELVEYAIAEWWER